MRVNGQVRKSRHDDLDSALTALESACRGIAKGERRDEIKVAKRTYSPVLQVQARAELRGPKGLTGGIDVRGDGSTEAYTGRLRKQLVEAKKGESAYAALRRALSSVSVEP